MNQAKEMWMRLYDARRLQDDRVFPWIAGLPAWAPVPLTLSKTFDDGSILRWSGRQVPDGLGGTRDRGWMAFDDEQDLKSAQWRGEIEGYRDPRSSV